MAGHLSVGESRVSGRGRPLGAQVSPNEPVRLVPARHGEEA